MRKTFPTLYCRDSNDKIRTWLMEQDGECYRTTSGILNGQLVISEWTTAQGKNSNKTNATTGYEQAFKEIEAKYKKQRKTGYFDTIEDIDNHFYFEVMLAKNLRDYRTKIKWKDGVIVQIKYNGARAVATKDGLFTRKGEKYISVPHINSDLVEFFTKYPDAILDGELYNYNLRQKLNELMSLVRKTKNITYEDLQKSKEIVRYYVYDGFGFGATQSDGYVTRKNYINNLLFKYTQYIKKVDDYLIDSEEKLEDIYKMLLGDDQEGVIVRLLGVPYENKRSKYLLKYKPCDESEFIIIDILSGEGNWSNSGKVIIFKDANNKQFKGTFKGNYEDCVQFLKDKHIWIGKTVSVEYNGLTGLGTPQYARLNFSNCLKS